MFSDKLAVKLFSQDEYKQMEKFISESGNSVADYVYTNLAPTPLARSRFCEDSLETAIRTGTCQYVILGCGYDTFSLRNTHRNIRIFEIDKEKTIRDKLARIERAGLSIPENACCISADLSKDSPRATYKSYALASSTFCIRRPTKFAFPKAKMKYQPSFPLERTTKNEKIPLDKLLKLY